MVEKLREINIQMYPNIKIDIPVKHRIQLIKGNSGAGKSLLFKHLKNAKRTVELIVESNISMGGLVLWNDKEDVDLSIEDKIVIADRAILVLDTSNKDILEFIRGSKNKFILITHSEFRELSINSSAVYELLYDVYNNRFFTRSYWDSDNVRLVGFYT